MKAIKTHILAIILGGIAVFFFGCEKFLDIKPSQKLVIPSKIDDLQGLLDNYLRLNFYEPSAAEISADDYYLSDPNWLGLVKEQFRRMYIWEKDNLFDEGVGEWSYAYDNVFRANTVLDYIDKLSIEVSQQNDLDNLKGQALALRARAFLKIAFIWAPAYDESSADNELGIPLRLNSDFNIASTRSTLRETYEQIIADLKQAIPLLPISQIHVLRTSKPAAYGLLARTYLSMRKYEEAGAYADSCLRIYNTLIDYNTLTASANYPFKQFNEEVILATRMLTPSSLGNNQAKIDSFLYASYQDGDLRKTMFFKDNRNGTYGFKGSYEGGASLFDGVASDEVYLMRAECNARIGKINEAMDDMNRLLRMRWDKKKIFIPIHTTNKEEALAFILQERRKELLMRGLRWMDIKRLNKEGANISLARKIKGEVYRLPPGDLRFALPIPEDVISLSGMKQNPR